MFACFHFSRINNLEANNQLHQEILFEAKKTDTVQFQGVLKPFQEFIVSSPHFNLDTGEFQAPVDGVYRITFKGHPKFGTYDWVDVACYVNGNSVGRIVVDEYANNGTGNFPIHYENSLELDKNDKVKFEVRNGNVWCYSDRGGRPCFVSGELIYPYI